MNFFFQSIDEYEKNLRSKSIQNSQIIEKRSVLLRLILGTFIIFFSFAYKKMVPNYGKVVLLL